MFQQMPVPFQQMPVPTPEPVPMTVPWAVPEPAPGPVPWLEPMPVPGNREVQRYAMSECNTDGGDDNIDYMFSPVKSVPVVPRSLPNLEGDEVGKVQEKISEAGSFTAAVFAWAAPAVHTDDWRSALSCGSEASIRDGGQDHWHDPRDG